MTAIELLAEFGDQDSECLQDKIVLVSSIKKRAILRRDQKMFSGLRTSRHSLHSVRGHSEQLKSTQSATEEVGSDV